VVSIVVTKDVPVYERYFENYNPFGGDSFFGSFQIPKVRENGTKEQEVGGGSGFIVSDKGLIITNRHVVGDDKATYSVILSDGRSFPVTVKAKDSVLDVAILQMDKLPDGDLPHLSFGDSSKVRLGDTVVAIGNALAEFHNTVSVGIISGKGRSLEASDGQGSAEQLSNVFQTDAAINPGNSGGPLINLQGEVIGVNVAASLGAQSIGFSLPAAVVSPVLESVVKFGEIRRPYLGVRYEMITAHMKEVNHLTTDFGALIGRGQNQDELAVVPGSPADKAGLRENDIILSVDGVDLKDTDLATVLRTKAVDATIKLRVLSQGEEKTLTVSLTKAPD
jgi:serine protease Do